MRVLLDECLPRGLKRHLSPHAVTTVPEAGWAGKKNGELLRVVAGTTDVFVTIDANLAYQQNVKGLSFAVIVLSAQSNRRADLLPLVPSIVAALASAHPGDMLRVTA
jgi:predicted nuclease of predicted toxin-antitoxin system